MFTSEILEFIVQFFMIFGIPILLFVGVIIILINVFAVPIINTKKSKIKTENGVKVIDKREVFQTNMYGVYNTYFATFLFPNGEKIDYKITKPIYKKINHMDEGNITYKESVGLCISFDITKKSGEKTDGNSRIVSRGKIPLLVDATRRK